MATIKRFEPIEIYIPTDSQLTRFYFPDLPNLRNALIDRLILFDEQCINPSIITGGNVAPFFNIGQTSITLYYQDTQIIYNCPLTSFVYQVGPASYYNIPLDFNGQIISWTKSYISSPNIQDSTNNVFSFGVFYHF